MSEEPKRRDFWERIGVVLQASGGLLTALTVAVLGFIGTNYLKDREMRDAADRERIQMKDTRTRIYTELMSRREEAESALRKDMFVSIIQTFLHPGSASLDENVLNLELLSYNFHESLNLKPLFSYLERRIRTSGGPQQKELMSRLYKVATEISRKQMLVLESAGQKTDRTVDLSNLKDNPGGFPLDSAGLTVEDIPRQFSIFVLAADEQTRELNLRLEIKTPKDNQGNVETNVAEFWVGYFDFPMIDNTRLPHDQRAAIVLNRFEDDSADITLAYFPGSYASLKEKPYYQDVIQDLLKSEGSMTSANGGQEPAPTGSK